MSKSIFTNSALTQKTVFEHLTTTILNDELFQIKKLLQTPVAVYIQMTINKYYLGDFEKLLELLPKEKLESLMEVLYSYRKNAKKYPIYEKVRSLLKLYLEGLIKCITQYLDMLNLESKLQECEERCSILDDMKKLQEYIDQIQKAMRIFNPPAQEVVCATIKQEHATYLRMYGYPVGGIFDVEKLNNIILNQNANSTTNSI
jgi:hypothetical protein